MTKSTIIQAIKRFGWWDNKADMKDLHDAITLIMEVQSTMVDNDPTLYEFAYGYGCLSTVITTIVQNGFSDPIYATGINQKIKKTAARALLHLYAVLVRAREIGGQYITPSDIAAISERWQNLEKISPDEEEEEEVFEDDDLSSS